MHTSKRRGAIARGLIAAALATWIGLGAAAVADASGRDHGHGIPDRKISVQLWTFAEYIGSGIDAATIARTEEVLRRLRDMGYRNVEPYTTSGLSAEQYRALLDKYGLKAPSRHVGVGTPQLPGNIAQIIADNKALGVKYFGSGVTPQLKTEAEWVAYAQYLNQVGEQAREAGQRLMVHNHNWEFETKFGDKTAFDVLLANTDKRNVVFQLDLYWAVFGGADPVALFERYGKRIRLAHVKDMRAGDRRIEIVGEGIIDFPRIFASTKGPLKYYVVEHDPRFGDATFDPFVAAEKGFDYLDDVRFRFGGHGKSERGKHDRDDDRGKHRGGDDDRGKDRGRDKDRGGDDDRGKDRGGDDDRGKDRGRHHERGKDRGRHHDRGRDRGRGDRDRD